jgi:hypothetical protein
MNFSPLCSLKLPYYKEKSVGVENSCKCHVWISEQYESFTTNIKNLSMNIWNRVSPILTFQGPQNL